MARIDQAERTKVPGVINPIRSTYLHAEASATVMHPTNQ